MKHILSLLLALAAIATVPRYAHAELKIGFVDLQRALEETEEGKKAKAKLKSEFEKKQKDLDQRQEDLKKKKAELDRLRVTMTAPAIQAKEQELQRGLAELQAIYVRLQKDLQEKEAAETQRIFKRMSAIIASIAQSEGLTLVLERNSGVLFAPPSLDLTNELIRKYNAASGGKETPVSR